MGVAGRGHRRAGMEFAPRTSSPIGLTGAPPPANTEVKLHLCLSDLSAPIEQYKVQHVQLRAAVKGSVRRELLQPIPSAFLLLQLSLAVKKVSGNGETTGHYTTKNSRDMGGTGWACRKLV